MAKPKTVITLADWCKKNKYPGVTQECVVSAFQSNDPEIQELAKREKLKGLIKDVNSK